MIEFKLYEPTKEEVLTAIRNLFRTKWNRKNPTLLKPVRGNCALCQLYVIDQYDTRPKLGCSACPAQEYCCSGVHARVITLYTSITELIKKDNQLYLKLLRVIADIYYNVWRHM